MSMSYVSGLLQSKKSEERMKKTATTAKKKKVYMNGRPGLMMEGSTNVPVIDLGAEEEIENLHKIIERLLKESGALKRQLKTKEEQERKRLKLESRLYLPFPHPPPDETSLHSQGVECSSGPVFEGYLRSRVKWLEAMVREQAEEIEVLKVQLQMGNVTGITADQGNNEVDWQRSTVAAVERQVVEYEEEESDEEVNLSQAMKTTHLPTTTRSTGSLSATRRSGSLTNNSRSIERSPSVTLSSSSFSSSPCESSGSIGEACVTPVFTNYNTSNANAHLEHAMNTAKCGGKQWLCICRESFPNKATLTRHIKSYTVDPKFQCEHCGMRFPKMCFLKEHLISSHRVQLAEGSMGCAGCGAVLPDRETYRDHRLSCYNKYQNARLFEHKKDETSAAMGQFKCTCGRQFISQQYLGTHLAPNRINRCKICQRIYTTPSKLRLHMLNAHNVLEKNAIGCAICGEMYTTKKEFLDHMHKAHRIITWPNHRLPDPWAEPRSQRSHGVQQLPSIIKTHGAHGLLQRCLCGSAYRSKALLKRHIELMKPTSISLRCPHCPSELRNYISLTKHIRNVHPHNVKNKD